MPPKQPLKKECFRLFVGVLKPLLLKYQVRDCHLVTRDSSQELVLKFYKKLLLKVHPDKGGEEADFKRLQAAKESFEKAGDARGSGAGRRPTANPTRAAGPGGSGRPGSAHPVPEGGLIEAQNLCHFCDEDSGSFRVQARAVLLTYNGVGDLGVWESFKTIVGASLKQWCVKYYGATLEQCRNGRHHIHLMLQFHSPIDQPRATFEVLGLKPNVRPGGGDYLDEKWTGQNAQTHINRGFFYTYANKKGTVLDEDGKPIYWGNYGPDWCDSTKYKFQVNARWPENLWKRHKLEHEQWEEYLELCRDGVQARQNNLRRVREAEEKRENAAEREEVVKRFRADPAMVRPFKTFPVIETWRTLMLDERMRYPILVIIAETTKGKSQLAKSIFPMPLTLDIGDLTFFPDLMRTFRRKKHGAIVLDDVRNLKFLTDHQHILQSKYDDDEIPFASTQGGTCEYTKYLYRVPFIVTANPSTENLDYLHSHPWLGKPENRHVLELTEDAFEALPTSALA